MKHLKQTIEAIIFAAGESISFDELMQYLPGVEQDELEKAISELKKEYSGNRGIHLLVFNNKAQFSTNPEYGETIAEVLTPLKERALSRSLLEVLSIIAYKEPITRQEIEHIRGVNSEYSLQMLNKMNLIKVIGRKNAPGRPSLYATTDEFLKKFELNSLNDLPDYQTLLDRIKAIEESYGTYDENLFREVEIPETFEE
ncbi:MAG: SMC-Scp complex subunit ScpB [Christensenellales bacterium]|jgi:segregation and condensation protein B